MKFDCYIFDLDGTLLDLGNIGFYADQILLETLTKLEVKKIPSKIERRELWFSGGEFQRILKKWGIPESTDFWEYYDKTDFEKRKLLLKNKEISLYKDVKFVLEQISNHKKRKKIAICTNTADYIVDYFLNHFEINNYFHETFSMGNNNQQFAKPSPEGILTILNKLSFNSNKKTVIMIGDSIHDIKAARAANISSCFVNHLGENRFERYKNWVLEPDYVIRHLHELLDI
ncbi:MAG: HAD family hydrolase [Candidatus Lokiarchaeia archaeon]|nr:HAD family hydrolase [Candidatus Lokiarchaeia archaeon]